MRPALYVVVRERAKGDVINRNLVVARSWTLLPNEILMGVYVTDNQLLLPLDLKNPQADSSMKPLVQSLTGRSIGGSSTSRAVQPQFTGTTTIARQFTGLRGGDAALARQLTGGGLSPTKQLGTATPRPRPKSVIGMRSGKSVDEGRGMFLVRQMTTGGSSFGV
jgi:hypothetical protein